MVCRENLQRIISSWQCSDETKLLTLSDKITLGRSTMTQFEYYFIICTGLAFFCQWLLILGLARRLRRAEGTIRWLKEYRRSPDNSIYEQPPENIGSLPEPRVIVYDESIDDWSKVSREEG